MTQDNEPVTRREIDQRLTALREHIDLKFKESERALAIAAKIEDEHFLTLNHEAARVKQVQDTYVLRDAFDQFRTSFQEWKEEITKTLVDEREIRRKELADGTGPLRDSQNMQRGKDQWLMGAVLTVVIVAAQLIARFISGGG